MNKVITDGVVLMPPVFFDGLDVWSSQNGTPGSNTYDGATNAALVPADSDFGDCLELVKTTATQKLRYMGDTPVLPGCYLRVRVRVKAISGNLPSVRIAAWAADINDNHVAGLTEEGTSVTLTTYGKVVTIEAIIGAGNRTGVDMIWGTTPVYGHFGLDLTGPDGGVVRIEDISITDATDVFHRKMMDIVDVRDYGAIGDGVADDSAAFEAADSAALGRTVLISKGIYNLASHVTFESKVRFEGTVTTPTTVRLALTRNFDLPTYIDAFGNEELALKKAIQAIFNFTDHGGLDMCGRRVTLSAPLDVHAAVVDKDTFANRRVIRNGQIQDDGSAAWDTDVFTSSANYAASNKTQLSNVANISQIPVGSLVTGTGVGREVYVTSKNVSASTIKISQPLYGAPTSQTYTFKRFKYLLDFSGFTTIKRFILADMEFLCQSVSSGVMLPLGGTSFTIRDCFFSSPGERAVTSIGDGCSGLQLDRNQFLSKEQTVEPQDRVTIAFNVNANDAKIRNNRAVRFLHFGVMNGGGHIISGNHFFQGDSAGTPLRVPGLILTSPNCKTTISGNYVDNCFIEWTNEHDESPDNTGSFSFGALTIADNIFTSIDSATWFAFIVVRPYGTDHFINGLNISGNTFKHTGGGSIDRVDKVDASIAPLDMTRARNVMVIGNTFTNIVDRISNPVTLSVSEAGATNTWEVELATYLPFGGRARTVAGVVPIGKIKNGSNAGVYTLPYATVNQGPNASKIKLNWSEPVTGTIELTARMDNPV